MAYERVLSVFRKHDEDTSGVIGREEFIAVMLQLDDWWTERRIDLALKAADADSDHIDYSLLLLWAFGDNRRQVLVRYVSGDLAFSDRGIGLDTPVSQLLRSISEQTGVREDAARLCSGDTVLRRSSSLGDSVSSDRGPVELTLLKMTGPVITPIALSGSHIMLLEQPLRIGSRCHFDRLYTFLDLGDFGDNPMMRYIRTSNSDKMTAADEVMWQLEVHMPVTVYLNFRSERHVTSTGASAWLQRGGWELSPLASTVSTGHPNGPYSGPVYSRQAESGLVELWGSNCDEGTYFVFIEIL